MLAMICRRYKKVTDKLLALKTTLQPILSALLELLEVPVDDSQWLALDPAQRRQHIMDAVKYLLLRESQVQPLCLVVENLHWIDAETQGAVYLSINSLISAIGERSRLAIAVLILYGLVLFLSSLAKSEEAKLKPSAAKHWTAFLAAIEGPWAGQARVTPIGPRPYDMTFVRTAPRRVEGEAHPGAWRSILSNGRRGTGQR